MSMYTCIPVYLQSEITSRDVVKVIQGTHIVSSFPFCPQMYTCVCTHTLYMYIVYIHSNKLRCTTISELETFIFRAILRLFFHQFHILHAVCFFVCYMYMYMYMYVRDIYIFVGYP